MSKYKITAHSELMQNYHPGDAVSPEGRFIALQTNSGASLLFSINTEHDFVITKEIAGDRHGWQRASLSSELVNNPKKPETGKRVCKTFAAAQSVHGAQAGEGKQGAVIQLALVVNDGTDDLLYLSLGNSDRDTSWTDSPKWTPCPFNAQLDSAHHKPSPFLIADVFIGEASDKEYIVVDVVRDPHSQQPSIDRYFIDVTVPGAAQWQIHDFDFDLDMAGYSSCLGRRAPGSEREKRHPADGLYTIGVVNSQPQFFYVPLHSDFGRPQATKLQLTPAGDVRPDAIAACRNTDNTSDLYAAGGGSLYYFPSNAQTMVDGNAATGTPLMKNRVFSGVKSLFASVTNGFVTVWGRNASNEVFYTTCVDGQEAVPGAWSVPLPIMREVEHLSPYMNRDNGANTFFVHAGGKLKVARKLPRSAAASKGAGTWKTQEVTIAPNEKLGNSPAQSFRSYTTRIRVTGSDDSRPKSGVPVLVQAPNGVSGFYINHRYYSAGPTPITVNTDATGSVTVVEAVSRLDGTQLAASVDGDDAAASINPFEKSPTVQSKLTKLADKNIDLRTVTFPDQSGRRIQLVRADANPDDVTAAHGNFRNLWEAHQQKVKGVHTNSALLASFTTAPTKDNRSDAYKKFVGQSTAVPVDAGDLLSMLEGRQRHAVLANASATGLASGESFWEMLVDFFVELGRIVWQVIVKIAGLIYEIFIDTVELIYNAITLVFDKILELGADLLIRFAMWLADIEKIKPIQADMKNWTQKVLEDQVNAIPGIQQVFDAKIDEAVAELKNWARTDLGEPGKQTLGALDSGQDGSPQDPASMLLTHVISEYYGDVAPASGKRFPDAPQSSFDVLWSALEKEADTLGAAFGDLRKLAQNASTMPLEAACRELIRILGEAVLKSAKVVVDAILTLLYNLARNALNWLLTDIEIPIVSDILSDWGITKFNVLDLICYVGALPVSLMFDFESKSTSAPRMAGAANNLGTGKEDSDNSLSDKTKAQRFAGMHCAAGICGLIATGLTATEQAIAGSLNRVPPLAAVGWFFELGRQVLLLAVTASLPEGQIKDARFRNLQWAAWGVDISLLLIFNPLWLMTGKQEFNQGIVLNVANRLFPMGNASVTFNVGFWVLWLGGVLGVLVTIPECVSTCWHLKELGGEDKSAERDLAIVDEVSNIMSFIYRWLSPAAWVIPAGPPKWIVIAIEAAAGGAHGIMQITEGAVGWETYKNRQHHAALTQGV